MNCKAAHQRILKGLQNYLKKSGHNKVVLGLSGGVDSALTFKLAIDALGNRSVAVLIMPELGLTDGKNIDHAKKLASFFRAKTYYVPINNLITDFAITAWKPNKIAQMNTKARIRSVLLYNYANTNNALVLGTSNKSELLLGYGTKYGDLAADLEVIGSLYKTEVYALAEFLNLPEEILKKAPTAELTANQTDEKELGASYTILDQILTGLELKKSLTSLVKAGFSLELIKIIQKRILDNSHKNKMPPVL
ncbi:MAG: NAD synthetase, NAD+ synthase [Candidatus Peregrinibacteria bacterium GW2011_GWE2_39_6]|nr:MAG: NAD synthetase, NAD+ synthase [Candidatus Peregrinibacteria bacterium GW2011_GWF2_39_17]KKR25268.1 MAG: NAD synthetase, NAD+ synthase [Candidatus Peregrinibacteria bacterium GW2011_GWE2_39_6]HCW32436.1 NAD(+) synthetase [Candidatus Peregrinibacteria bacterium]